MLKAWPVLVNMKLYVILALPAIYSGCVVRCVRALNVTSYQWIFTLSLWIIVLSHFQKFSFISFKNGPCFECPLNFACVIPSLADNFNI